MKNSQKSLLIVDLQKTFNPPDSVVAQINTIASDYYTVVATQFLDGNPLFQKRLAYGGHTSEELALCVLPKHAKVFTKTGYGLPEDLMHFLSEQKITEIDVCGVETEACVLASMFNLWDAGIQPNPLEDLITTKPKNNEYHDAAMKLIHKNFMQK